MNVSAQRHAGLLAPTVADRCLACGKVRVPLAGIARGGFDPFCSTLRAIGWYGIVLAGDRQ